MSLKEMLGRRKTLILKEPLIKKLGSLSGSPLEPREVEVLKELVTIDTFRAEVIADKLRELEPLRLRLERLGLVDLAKEVEKYIEMAKPFMELLSRIRTRLAEVKPY